MAELKVTINTDNAAFEGTTGAELAEILRSLAAHAEQEEREGVTSWSTPLRDANGNTVGRAELVS